MNKICKTLLMTCLVWGQSLGLRAQEEPPVVSFFRVANATGLEDVLRFYLDGAELNRKGYKSGENTGALGVSVPMVKLKATHPLCEPFEFPLKLKQGDQFAVIAYIVPQIDPKTGEIKKRLLKFSILERKPDDKKRSARLLFLSVKKPIDLDLNGKKTTLVPMKPVDVELSNGVSNLVNLAVGEQKIGSFSIEETGDHAVIVFEKADGTYGSINFGNTMD